MSTNKSQNLNLHLWEPEDNFLRTEFNENFAAIDTAVTTAKTELSSKIQTAQSTADTARTEAAMLPYATGVYTGNGYGQFIELGFRPSIVIIGEYHDTSDSSYAIGLCSLHGPMSAAISISDTGFQVAVQLSRKYPATNLGSRTYYYIAFR